jgi:redox-sensitive bicupin YhaK (pirin superfamily)
MSDLEKDPAEVVGSGDCDGPALELLEPREVVLGRTTKVRRLLPNKNRRMVGAWCFVDHYGPVDLSGRVDSFDVPGDRGMQVPPHPHTSLQTVSWLFEGEIEHRDTVGSHAFVRPGELNIMTAGNGIAHSEVSTPNAPPIMHGAQLWVALPDSVRSTTPPTFNAYAELPTIDFAGAHATVMIGTVAGVTSPAPAFTPLVGADVTIEPGRTLSLPLTPSNEYAVLIVDGSLSVGELAPGFGEMVYLGAGREAMELVASDHGVRFLLLGGEPFEEQLVMWWNFIGRSHEEIVAARDAWQSAIAAAGNDRFPMVPGYDGDPLPAPALPAIALKPRPRAR